MTAAQTAGVSLLSAGDTVRSAQRAMTDAFRSAGIASPQLDARLLLQEALGLEAAKLIADPDRAIAGASVALNAAIARRLKHEPVSRIFGRREFFGRQFLITPDVLDPRPETETVVELVLDVLRANDLDKRAIAVADVGIGSGALLLTLLAELPLAHGTATDVSEAALAVAAVNADRLGVAGRTKFCHTRGLEDCTERFDLIVSNPPYIASHAIASLDPEVRDYDPRLALDGGPDGLQVYREIARDISAVRSPCCVVVECGAGQNALITEVFAGIGARLLEQRRDHGGHIRAVAFQIHP